MEKAGEEIQEGEQENYSSWEEFLIDSCRFGELEDVKECLSNGVDVNFRNEQKNTGLHMAAANGHLEIVKLVTPLMKKELINSQNEAGNTPLHWAVLNNKKFIVEYLLSLQADCNLKNEDGERPLDIAIKLELPEMLEQIAPFTAMTAEEIKESEEVKEDEEGEDEEGEEGAEDKKKDEGAPQEPPAPAEKDEKTGKPAP
jgi:hypothetical protein